MLPINVRSVLVLTLVAAATASGFSLRAGRAWQEMLASGVELERAIEESDTTRPVLRGESTQGMAYPEYAKMVRLLSPGAQDNWHEYKARANEDAPDDAARDMWIDSHEELLESLALAARQSDARFPGMWEPEREKELSSMMTGRTVVGIALLAARRNQEAGRHASGVDVLLDAMQFSRDVMHAPSEIEGMVGCSLLQICLSELTRDVEALGRMPAMQLARLARGLERLDSGLAFGLQGIEGDTAFLIRVVAAADSPEDRLHLDADWRMSAWRHGFSSRQVCADYVQEAMDWRAFQAQAQGLDWTSLRQRYADAMVDFGESSNPIGSNLPRLKLSVERTSRSTLTRLRLARAAIDYQLTGTAEPLGDPFGTQLLASEGQGVMRFASLGPGDEQHGERYSLEVPLLGQ